MKYIYVICKYILQLTFLNEPELFFAQLVLNIAIYNSHNLTSVICLHIVCSI